MSALTVTLGADITALRRSMSGATAMVAASAKKMASLTAAGLKVGLGAALAGGGVALAAGMKAVTSAADFEQTKVAFATLIGDAGKAEQTLAQLRELGAKTPFEFPELADAGRKLIAFGEGSDTVAATLARIGDVSAGVQAPVNEIAELYGKARVQGRLFAEDINQLTGRGIPIIGELAKQFGVSDSEVKKLVESGKVGFPDIERAFIDMTSQGGKFAGMMEAQSKTTNGLFSTLKDTINEVFLTLGTPINDAIRPLVEQAIGLVQKLAPLAAEAGKRVREAVMFVIAAFKSGQILDLVASSMKLAFAMGVNTLVNGFRLAVEFFWNLLTDGAMWKILGTTLLGLAAGFGAALLNAFQTPIVYLQAGMEWVVAHLLKGLLKIPGMADLLGFDESAVETNFDKILKDRKETGGELFGFNMKELAKQADDLMSSGAPKLGERVAEAARKAGESSGSELIDTTALRDSFGKVVGSIRDSIRDTMPKPEEVKQAATAAAKTTGNTSPTAVKQSSNLAPIVTSLGKVGGGGYSSGTLDAQRENNKLTSETNRILRDMSERMKPGGVAPVTAFG